MLLVTVCRRIAKHTDKVDYCFQNYFFTFEDGESSKILSIQAIDDNVVEPDKKSRLTVVSRAAK